MDAYYNLFKRQWQRGRATKEDIGKAVEKGYITEAEGEEIKALEQSEGI